MTIYATLNDATDQTRQALHTAFAAARAAGDRAEMERLKALAGELDALGRRLALGALADTVAGVEAIRLALIAQAPAAGATGGGDAQEDTQEDARTGGGPADGAADKTGGKTAGKTVGKTVGAPDGRPGGKADGARDDGAGGTAPDEDGVIVQATGGAGDGPAADDPVPPASRMAWGAVARRRHGEAFNDKVRAIAGRLGCDPNHLMAAMAFETAETFSPSIVNGAGSGATGLIQFMPSTARRLGTTTARLARMSALDQLDLVEAYFRSATRRQLRTLSDVYMAILWPIAVGKPESHVLFRKPGRAYTQNRGFDVNGDGVITKAEAAAKVQQKLVKGMKAGRIG